MDTQTRRKMDKLKLITQLKTEYKTLTKQVNGETVELNQDEYEATIDAWADVELSKQAKQIADETKALAKSALLDKLGITAEEAALLFS